MSSANRELTPSPKLPAEVVGFDWGGRSAALGSSLHAVAELVVRQPNYLAAFASLWSSQGLDDGKRWARWRVIHARAPWLPDAVVAEDFAFYGRRLTGAEQITKVGYPTKWLDCSKL